ncbi:MAG: GntR family transcriptional regulator [Gemmatimonadaceae bacterium]
MPTSARLSKHARVFATLRREIEAGSWKRGERLPSEADLIRRFGLSRITVGRALRDLQLAGLVERRAGSGTFVRRAQSGAGLSFGLLIPDLGESEIFEPICQGMMASPLARDHALVWGSATTEQASKGERALQLCRHYIERGVSGVFFAPLEDAEDKDEVNTRIVAALDAARVPVVLLDRTVLPYPEPGQHDLVGIDNRRAGYVITEHLLRLGCGRVAFVAAPNAVSTVDAREAGYREALSKWNVQFEPALVSRIDPEDVTKVETLLERHPDGIVCANDRTAGRLMQSMRFLGYDMPNDIRLVGIDDVEYARLLPVPLTTLRQPTRQIGETALAVMLDRVARPSAPPRHTLLHCELIVRESSGAKTAVS